MPRKQAKKRFTPPLSRDRYDLVLEALSKPLHREVACSYAAVSLFTFRGWLSRGSKLRDGGIEEPTPYDRWCLKFLIDVERTEAEAEQMLALHILKAAGDDWRAAAHYLACRYPGRWSKNERRQIEARLEDASGTPGGAMEELRELLAMPAVADLIEEGLFDSLDGTEDA